MIKLIDLKGASDDIICSVSPANYIIAADNSVRLKNSPRLRLLINNDVFLQHEPFCDRLVFMKFNVNCMGLILRIDDAGNKAAVIKKGSGRLDFSIPLNHKILPNRIDPRYFPKIRKKPCKYRFKDQHLLILLPIQEAI